MCVIDLIIRMSSAKLMETVAAAVSLTGAMFWFLGSCFLFTKKVSNPMSQAFDGILDEFDMDESFLNLFKNTLNEGFYEPTHAQIWPALWIVGSLCNLYTFVYDLYIIMQEKERAKPLFKTFCCSNGNHGERLFHRRCLWIYFSYKCSGQLHSLQFSGGANCCQCFLFHLWYPNYLRINDGKFPRKRRRLTRKVMMS